MTWLEGTTTWAALAADLSKLITGEMADSKGVTCAAGDRWIRDPLTTVADALRSPMSTDTPALSGTNRAGYWALTGSSVLTDTRLTTMRQTTVQTSQSTTRKRLLIGAKVTTVNTTPGNYSTAQVSYTITDADDGTAIVTNQAVAVTAAGVWTPQLGISVTVADPSGTLQLNTSFVRLFDWDNYRGGIDMIPMLARRSGAVTWGTAPPGVEGTDWALAEFAVAPFTNGNAAPSSLSYVRGVQGYGVGIKTAAALTGALYDLSFTCARHRMRLTTPTAPYVTCESGRVTPDLAVPATVRSTGLRASQWLRPYTTAGSVLSTSALQYFLSVTSDGIAVVLNADPGATGKLTVNYLGSITPFADPAIDLFTGVTSVVLNDYTTDTIGNHWSMTPTGNYLWVGRKLLESAATVGRDWQLGVCRADHLDRLGSGAHTTDATSNGTVGPMQGIGLGTAAATQAYPTFPIREEKPGVDGTWRLYLPSWFDGDPQSNTADVTRTVRGWTDRFAFVPGDGWASGDVLTDTATGQKWLLLMPDYTNIGGRWRASANVYVGGVAIRQA